MKYKATYPITSAQIDADYHLSIDGLLNFHENTVAKYFTTLRLAAFDLQKEDKTWVISEINLEMPEPPTMWSEDVEITVWLSEISTLRVWMDFEAREVHSHKLTARGNSCWSMISMSLRKLLPCSGLLPDTELVTEFAAGPHKKRYSVHADPKPIMELGHVINHIDLDFNGHTNNRRYIQMALACFDQDFLTKYRPDRLNIRFIHESRLNEIICNHTYPTDDPSEFVGIIKNSEESEICRVVSHWTIKEKVPDIAEVNLLRCDGSICKA